MAFSSAAPLEKWSPTVVSQPNRVRSMTPRAKHGWWCCLHGKVWPEKKGPQLAGCVMCHHHVIGIQMGMPLFLLHSISIFYHFWSFQAFFSTAIVTSASRIWNRSQVECHGGWHDEGFRPTVFCQDLQPGAGRVTWHHSVNVKWVSWG